MAPPAPPATGRSQGDEILSGAQRSALRAASFVTEDLTNEAGLGMFKLSDSQEAGRFVTNNNINVGLHLTTPHERFAFLTENAYYILRKL